MQESYNKKIKIAYYRAKKMREKMTEVNVISRKGLSQKLPEEKG